MRLIGSLSGIRTSLRQHIHSLPPSHRSPYLERHMLAKQKERLEREIALLEGRCHQSRQRMADIEAHMEALADKEKANKKPTPPSLGSERHRVARMTIEY